MTYAFTRTGPEIEVIHNTVSNLGNIISNKNLIPNSDFSIAGSVANPPDSTPRSYNAGDELFFGFKAAGSLSNVTYIDGSLNGSGQLYIDVYKTEKEKLSLAAYTASVSSSDGFPVESGISFIDNGDYWRITFDMVDVFSVKLEQGGNASVHETQYSVVSAGSERPRSLEERFAEVINVKDEGAVGGGVVDDSIAIGLAIEKLRERVISGKKVKLEFPTDTYKCSGLVWNLSGLGTAQCLIEGNNSIIEFDSLGNKPVMVDFINSKEISVYNLRLRYGGDFDRPASECPNVGLLFARNSSNEYSGRHKLFNVFVTGTYQLASFYNAGCEENAYYHVEFRNNLEGKRACVVTSSNHLGATSEFEPITTTNISTTLNIFIKPVFWTDGRAREAVCLRGVGGLTMMNPYSSSGAIAHYAIQAIDSSVTGVSITGYQAEVDRGSLGVSADYIFRFEGDGTLDVINCDIKSQFSTKVLGEGTIEGVRDFKRTNITVGGLVRDIGASDSIQGCDIKAAAGITLNSITEIVASNFYSDLKNNIDLPNVSSNCTVTATDIEGELSIGKFKQKSVSTTVTLDASVVGLDGGGTVTNFNSDFNGVGMPFVEQKFYCYGVGANVTIENGTGNILTNTQSDITLATGQYIEVRYLGHADKYFVMRMTG